MELQSKLLGKIEYAEENIIRFEEGLIGIPDKKNYLLIEKEDFRPFSYLQSVDDPTFILIVVNPMIVEKEYKFSIYKDDLNALDIRSENDFSLMAIVIFAQKVEHITVNLKAPILINIHTKKALQVILQNDDYTVEEPLVKTLPNKPDGSDIFKTR
jgi:flagellar assembly factor FliW